MSSPFQTRSSRTLKHSIIQQVMRQRMRAVRWQAIAPRPLPTPASPFEHLQRVIRDEQAETYRLDCLDTEVTSVSLNESHSEEKIACFNVPGISVAQKRGLPTAQTQTWT